MHTCNLYSVDLYKDWRAKYEMDWKIQNDSDTDKIAIREIENWHKRRAREMYICELLLSWHKQLCHVTIIHKKKFATSIKWMNVASVD